MGARPKQVRREVHSASASASASHETEEAGSSTAAHVALAERPGESPLYLDLQGAGGTLIHWGSGILTSTVTGTHRT